MATTGRARSASLGRAMVPSRIASAWPEEVLHEEARGDRAHRGTGAADLRLGGPRGAERCPARSMPPPRVEIRSDVTDPVAFDRGTGLAAVLEVVVGDRVGLAVRRDDQEVGVGSCERRVQDGRFGVRAGDRLGALADLRGEAGRVAGDRPAAARRVRAGGSTRAEPMWPVGVVTTIKGGSFQGLRGPFRLLPPWPEMKDRSDPSLLPCRYESDRVTPAALLRRRRRGAQLHVAPPSVSGSPRPRSRGRSPSSRPSSASACSTARPATSTSPRRDDVLLEQARPALESLDAAARRAQRATGPRRAPRRHPEGRSRRWPARADPRRLSGRARGGAGRGVVLATCTEGASWLRDGRADVALILP